MVHSPMSIYMHLYIVYKEFIISFTHSSSSSSSFLLLLDFTAVRILTVASAAIYWIKPLLHIKPVT